MNGRWIKYVLQEKQGEANGGGGGVGDLLSGDHGGGTSKEGDQNSGSTPGAGDETANNSSGDSGAGGAKAADWRSALPTELQENPQIKRYGTVADLAAGYVNLQKQFSGDKLVVPGKNATDEDWQQVFAKLGVPKEVKDYTVKFKDGTPVDDTFSNEFKALAHKVGILPKQAQALADWFSDKNQAATVEYQTQRKAQSEKAVAGLKAKWGDAYQTKLAAANAVFKEVSPELQKAFKDSGLASSTVVTEFLATIAEKYLSEDQVLEGGSGGTKKYTPGDAKKAADAIIGDRNHPYHQKDHPGHRAAVEEVSKLFNMMHPGS